MSYTVYEEILRMVISSDDVHGTVTVHFCKGPHIRPHEAQAEQFQSYIRSIYKLFT